MSLRILAYLLTAAVLCCVTSHDEAQTTSANQPNPKTKSARLAMASRAWRLAPVDSSTQHDTVDSTTRAARNAYWERVFPPIASQIPMGYTSGGVVTRGPKPQEEFTSEALRYPWVIATFESYRVYPIPHADETYTEINLRIDHVFNSGLGTQSELRPNMLIDVAIRGGVLRSATGKTITFLPDDQKIELQPSHKYLLQVVPCAAVTSCGNADFYFLGRKWDITDGTVRPVETREVRMWRDGKSLISGTDAASLIPRFEQILAHAAQVKP
jgi:hypothetical protein